MHNMVKDICRANGGVGLRWLHVISIDVDSGYEFLNDIASEQHTVND